MKIFLIGMPGAGKSTLGKQLATELKYDFYDLDYLLVKDQKSGIQTLFEEKGAQYFRRIESEMLRKIISENDHFVMATGGGTPCYHHNMKVIKDNGKVIYLDVPLKTLIQRNRSQELVRPLLNNPETLKDRLTELFNSRIHIFREADLTLTGPDLEVNEILYFLKNQPKS